jgi:hypothetical protein
LKIEVQDWFYVSWKPYIKGKIGSWIYETIDQGYIIFYIYPLVSKGDNTLTLEKTSVKWVFEFLINIEFGYF